MWNKINSLVIVMILGTASLIILGSLDESTEAAEPNPSRGPLEDAFNLYATGLSSLYYPGDSDQFFLQLENDYDGSGYIGDPPLPNATDLEYVRLSLIGIYNSDLEPVGNSPITWTASSIYNGPGDLGYDIPHTNTRAYYADDLSNQLEFEVKMNGISPGIYLMAFREDFRYLKDYDTVDYTWADGTNTDYVEFRVRSYIGPDNTDLSYTMMTFDENLGSESLYTGAKRQVFGVTGLYSLSGSITEVHATLTMDGNPIEVETATSYQPTLTDTICWRITVPKELPAGFYHALLRFSYEHDGEAIVQEPTLQTFRVEYTPLLLPPDHKNMTFPVATVTQHEVDRDIEVGFTNHGNVDLLDVQLRLDLDNSYYLKGDKHFYNQESGSSNEEWNGITVSLGDVSVGASATATFEEVKFRMYLPPGSYMVPVDYYARYLKDGSLNEPSGDAYAGYWQEKGYYQHREIMRSIVHPEDKNNDYLPYIMIEVEDDPLGPDITAEIQESYINQRQGYSNRYIRFSVYNYEFYEFQGLEYTIYVDDSSPFNPPGYPEVHNTTTLPPIFRPNLRAATTTNIYSDSINFYADIKDRATPGLNYVRMDITGLDEFMQPVTKTVYMEVNIQISQPRLQVLEVKTGNITDDMEVMVTTTIHNFGPGDVNNLSAFFVSSSAGYENTEPPRYLGGLEEDESVDYVFTFKATSKNRYFHGTYYGYIYFEYMDDTGEWDDMFSGQNFYIKVDIYDKLPDIVIMKVEAPLIDRKDTVEVQVTIINLGGTEATNVRLMVPHNTNQFSVQEDVVDVGTLAPDGEATVTFHITALNEISDSTTYSFSLYTSYTNVEGRTMTFSEGEKETFYLRTKDRIIPSEQKQIVEDKSTIISEGAGSFMMGIMILIGLIILAVLFSKAITNGRQTIPTEAKTRAPPMEEPKVSSRPDVVLEEDEEEQEEEGTEEDDEDW